MPFTRKAFAERSPDDLVEALADLEESPLGQALLATLRIAQEVDLARFAAEQAAKRSFRSVAPLSAVEGLAEWLIDQIGPPEDAYRLREQAEKAVERLAEYDIARMS